MLLFVKNLKSYRINLLQNVRLRDDLQPEAEHLIRETRAGDYYQVENVLHEQKIGCLLKDNAAVQVHNVL